MKLRASCSDQRQRRRKDILPRALECVREIARSLTSPCRLWWHQQCSNARDTFEAGASIVGIGSALIGMTTNQIADYFRTLTSDLEGKSEQAEALVDIDMGFRPVTLVDNKRITDDICILRFDRKSILKQANSSSSGSRA